jgi:glycosyltransferase involved in cell wall biosynthesis
MPRVVIAHDFTEAFGGAERVVAEIANAFPEAPVWSIIGRSEVARQMGVDGRASTVLPEWEPALEHYRILAPLYPALVRARRLPACDVLITSSYAFAHGFRTRNDAPQICFCHSPLRFAWSMTAAYKQTWAGRNRGSRAFEALASVMRAIDRRAARNVTRYIASSHFVAGQIERFYGRRADVLWPPVDCRRFRPSSETHEGYFLFCGRLVEPYKRAALAIEAFRALPHRLVIAGDGPALGHLRQIAGSNVEFTGYLKEADLIPLMQRCAALVFPSRDDFGLTPVEVMACGRPVIAYAGGGALETVVPGRTGELFERQDSDSLRSAISAFDPDAYDTHEIRSHAESWDTDRFAVELGRIVDEVSDAYATAPA